MNSIEEENIPKNEFLKTYLHIHNPTLQDKPYYKLDLSKNILYLHNKINISESDKEGIFEFDKIFTNEKDNNLFIYKTICENILKESFNGKSHCLISYGNTMSDKFKTLIGDINNKGILMQTLDDIINNYFDSNENIKAHFSFFALYKDKLLDLNNYNDKIFNDKLEDNLMKKSIELSKNNEINNLNKINLDKNTKDEVNNKIDKLFSELIKIELESKYHIYSQSHFCFIIFFKNEFDHNTISTLTFILLNGSELLNKNTLSKKAEVSSSLISVDSQYIFNSIIYFTSQNKTINPNYLNYEKDKTSKLTSILNDICFNPTKANIKFVILGNIIPITGYYETTKDTLMFLFNMRQKCLNNKNNNKKNGRIISRKLSNNTKDDIIFDLENKIKYQADNIERMNKIVEKKDQKIFDLEKNYKVQVDFLKKFFGFKGQVEVLLSGDVNTKEYQEALNIKEAKENAAMLKRNIRLLEKDLKKKEEEIDKIKQKEDIKLNDQIMIKYYLLAEDIKNNKEKDNENKREFFTLIQNLENDIKNKNKIISELKKEIEQKNKILLSLPKSIKNHINKKERNEEETKEETKDKKDTEENVAITKEIKKKKKDLMDIIKLNEEEKYKIKLKYENLLSQSQKQIEEKNKQINDIIENNKIKYNSFKDELAKLYNIFINIINSYYKNKNKITLFEKYISNIEIEINEFNFPNIFKLIPKQNIKKNYITKIKKEETINNNENNNKSNTFTSEKIKETVLNFDDSSQFISLPQIINFMKLKNSNIFSYNKNQLEQISKENLIRTYLEIITYIQKLENYIQKYNKSQINNHKNINIKEDIITEYEEKIKKLKEALDKEIQKNYNDIMIINSQKKIIEENNYKNILNTSKNRSKDFYPTISNTLYNKENNFLKYRNSSKIRTSTEKNIYQPTIASLSDKNNYYNKLFGNSMESFDKFNKSNNTNKKRPLSSTSKAKGKRVSFENYKNNSNK